MSNPPGLPPDPNAPPTAPMYPAPPAAPPTYPVPSAASPTDPVPPAAPQPPPQAPGYQPSAYPPPPAYQEPPSGYSVPSQYSGAVAGGWSDPLVLPPGAPFGAWFSKVQEIAKRSWKSALIIAALGIAVPRALVTLISWASGWGTGLSITGIGGVASAIGSLFLGLLATLVFSIAACYVAAAGWAAGTWALVQEAQTGRPASIPAAFQYGMKRAMALFPWTVLAAVAFTIASACLWLPGVYVAFGFSMFGFVALFERGTNPVSRSFSLTHNSATIGPTLGKIGILFGVYLVYTIIIGAIFTGIAVAVGIGFGFTNSFGYNIGFGLIQAIGSLLTAPALAVLLIGLLPTYAELRARVAPLTTSQLQQELGG
jgi:hypothetical protein